MNINEALNLLNLSQNVTKEEIKKELFLLADELEELAINGKTVIDKQEIPGITGGALDSKEGEPGPLYIQGDHGSIEFRKITITEAGK